MSQPAPSVGPVRDPPAAGAAGDPPVPAAPPRSSKKKADAAEKPKQTRSPGGAKAAGSRSKQSEPVSQTTNPTGIRMVLGAYAVGSKTEVLINFSGNGSRIVVREVGSSGRMNEIHEGAIPFDTLFQGDDALKGEFVEAVRKISQNEDLIVSMEQLASVGAMATESKYGLHTMVFATFLAQVGVQMKSEKSEAMGKVIRMVADRAAFKKFTATNDQVIKAIKEKNERELKIYKATREKVKALLEMEWTDFGSFKKSFDLAQEQVRNGTLGKQFSEQTLSAFFTAFKKQFGSDQASSEAWKQWARFFVEERVWSKDESSEFIDAYTLIKDFEKQMERTGDMEQALDICVLEVEDLESAYTHFPCKSQQFKMAQQLAKVIAKRVSDAGAPAPHPPPAAVVSQQLSKDMPVTTEGMVKAFGDFMREKEGFDKEGQDEKILLLASRFLDSALRTGTNTAVPVELVGTFMEGLEFVRSRVTQFLRTGKMDRVSLVPNAMLVPDMVRVEMARLKVLAMSEYPPFSIEADPAMVLDFLRVEKHLSGLTEDVRKELKRIVNSLYVTAFKAKKTLYTNNFMFLNIPVQECGPCEDAVESFLFTEFPKIPTTLRRSMARDIWFLLSSHSADLNGYWNKLEVFREARKRVSTMDLRTLLVKQVKGSKEVVIVIDGSDDEDSAPAAAPAAAAPAAAPVPVRAPAAAAPAAAPVPVRAPAAAAPVPVRAPAATAPARGGASAPARGGAPAPAPAVSAAPAPAVAAAAARAVAGGKGGKRAASKDPVAKDPKKPKGGSR